MDRLIRNATYHKLFNAAVHDDLIVKEPFQHIVLDDFFEPDIADQLSKEFPAFDSPFLWNYDSPLEKKRTCDDWTKFPGLTYRAFFELCSDGFTKLLSSVFKVSHQPQKYLLADYGLHGGGWHMHGRGGKLNIHQDYSIHPKMTSYKRNFNIIIHLSKDWNPSWGGGIQLWSHNNETNRPKECIQNYDFKFNRAVIFDTTCNSWHGLPDPLDCPEDQYRKTFAVYYLSNIDQQTPKRYRALYAPTKEQEGNQEIERMIEERVSIK